MDGILTVKSKKAKFTWHYYLMASGALMAMLAASLSAWSALVTALCFTLLTHPIIKLPGVSRFVFLILLAIFYVLAFPEASVVQEMMAATHENS